MGFCFAAPEFNSASGIAFCVLEQVTSGGHLSGRGMSRLDFMLNQHLQQEACAFPTALWKYYPQLAGGDVPLEF